MGSVYKEVYKEGVKWRADWIDKNKKRHRSTFDTKGAADKLLTEVKSKMYNGNYVSPKDIPTFSEIADAWITPLIEKARVSGEGHRPGTLAPWQNHIAHLNFCFENVKINQIDADAIEAAISTWQLPRGKRKRGLSLATINKILTTMSRIFLGAIRKKRGIEMNPVKLIEKPKQRSGEQTEDGKQLARRRLPKVTEKQVLTPEETKRVILAAAPGFYQTFIQVGIYTGARISELMALRWSDVNFSDSLIHIRRTVSTTKVKGEVNQERVRWFDPKTKPGVRDIPIPPELIAALRAWKEKAPGSRLDLVFCNGFGELANRTGFGRQGLTPALKQAGIEKNVTPHGLRHTYASMLILLGRPLPEISKYLGHADVLTTMRIYAHFLGRKGQDTMSDLAGLIKNA